MGQLFIDYWTIYNSSIEQFEKLGDKAEAVVCAEQLVRHFPGMATAHLRHAELLLKAERFDDADRAFERALKLDPFHAPIVAAYVKRLCERKDFAKAIAAAQPMLLDRPDLAELAGSMCRALIQEQRIGEAKSFAEQHLKIYPASGAVKLELLRASFLLRDAQAPIQLALCQELAASDPPFGERLAAVLIELEKPGDALNVLQMLVSKSKISLDAFQNFIQALEKAGNLTGALAAAEKVLTQVPSPEVGREVRRFSRALGKTGAKREHRILMVSERPRVREAKIAHALKPHGWDVTLLYAYKPNFELGRFFDESIQFKSPEEALTIADRLNIPIHHVFSLRADGTSCAFVREKLAFTIFDPTDVYDSLIYNDFAFHEPQRFCITHADALVCRDLTVKSASRLGGYQLPKPILYFPEYCWGELLPPAKTHPANEIHIVQSGWMDIERYTGAKEGNYGELVTTFARAGIHVHIYQHIFAQSEPLKEVYQDFLALGRQTGCVHVHENVPLDQVTGEFQNYDLGLLSVQIGSQAGKTGYDRRLSRLSLQSAGAARISEYLEAGLPVIMSPVLRYQVRNSSRYGVNIPLTEELLKRPRETLAPFCTPEIRAEVRRKCTAFSLSVHAPRLIAFYRNCLELTGRARKRPEN